MTADSMAERIEQARRELEAASDRDMAEALTHPQGGEQRAYFEGKAHAYQAAAEHLDTLVVYVTLRTPADVT